MHKLFKNLNNIATWREPPLNFPIQLAEDANFVVVRALAPGIRQQDLDVVLTGQQLAITGRIAYRTGRYLRQECPCGSFRRDVDLGCAVDGSRVAAELKAGVLTITLPKQQAQQPCRIQIKYGS